MREILFKAKRIDNGEWVEGCYAVHKGKIFIGVSINETFYIPVLSWLEVTSETLCQFTGLCDKNGVTKIFEGDILYKEGHWTFFVGYEMGAFRAIPLRPVQRINWSHCTLEEFLRIGMGDRNGFKVIGNIREEEESQ